MPPSPAPDLGTECISDRSAHILLYLQRLQSNNECLGRMAPQVIKWWRERNTVAVNLIQFSNSSYVYKLSESFFLLNKGQFMLLCTQFSAPFWLQWAGGRRHCDVRFFFFFMAPHSSLVSLYSSTVHYTIVQWHAVPPCVLATKCSMSAFITRALQPWAVWQWEQITHGAHIVVTFQCGKVLVTEIINVNSH